MNKKEKVAIALTIIGVLGIIVNNRKDDDKKILGMEKDTVNKIFCAFTVLGGIIIIGTSIEKIK